jgi:hypothetical protein
MWTADKDSCSGHFESAIKPDKTRAVMGSLRQCEVPLFGQNWAKFFTFQWEILKCVGVLWGGGVIWKKILLTLFHRM